MSKFLEAEGLPYSMSAEKAYSTDANMLGATHEAKDLEHLDKSMKVVNPIMGVAHWKPDVKIDAETVTVAVGAGRAGGAQRQALRRRWSSCSWPPTRIGGRHGLGMSDQIENRVIDAKSRGIYEAPAMALLHLTYERLLSVVHNENTTDLYVTLGRKPGPPPLRGPAGSTPRRCCSRRRWCAGCRPAITGEVTLELRRGDDLTILYTARRAVGLRAREAVDGEDRGRLLARGPHRRARAAEPVGGATTARCCCTTRRRWASSRAKTS